MEDKKVKKCNNPPLGWEIFNEVGMLLGDNLCGKVATKF